VLSDGSHLHLHPRVFGERTPAHDRHAGIWSGGAAHFGERRHPVAEEHRAEGGSQQIVFIQRGGGRIDLPPIDIGEAGGTGAPLTVSQHWLGNVEPHHAAGRTDGARKFQRGRAAAAADIHHPLTGAWCSKAEQGVRHRCERDVGVLPSHPGIAALAVPEGE
jgi:hypothetical protein